MALGKRWSLTFKSLNNVECNVYIYDEGWTGAVTALVGADEPFFYQEDDDESLLTVLRYRTGYLRVVENSYNALLDLYPTSSTSRYVEMYYGERLDFTGYLQTQNFQSPWVASPRVLEFPIISPLGICETRKFSLYTTPTRITLGACLFNILTDLNNHAASGSRYTRVIFPDTGPEFTGSINTMVISGFSDQFSHADPDSPVFAAEYYNYLLEGICNAYGWILHDTPEAFIFTRFDWDGSYAYYDLTTLAVPTNKQTIADVAGNDVNTLLDSFKVMDANATENLVQPLKSLTLEYQGKDIETADMSLARTYTQAVKPGGRFGFDTNPQDIPGVVWLKAADNEFTGARLLDTNTLQNNEYPTNAGCNLTYIGTQGIGYAERMLIGWDINWSVNSELFIWKIYQPPVGDCNFEMNVSWGYTIATLGHERRVDALGHDHPVKFAIWLESGGKYYDFASFTAAGFTSSSRVTGMMTIDEEGDGILSIRNVPPGVLTIGFLVGDTPALTSEVVSIDAMSLSRRTFVFAQYTEVQNPIDRITGNDAGEMEGSVTLSLNCYRNDTHLIGLAPVAEKFTEYPYLFEPMNRVVCHFTATEFDMLKNYLGKWKFWIKWWRWRIVSLSFSPWDDLYTLTLHRSPSIESRGYLADVNDNVFQSLDEYLFTVLTDEPPTPPTPPLPYDAEVEYLQSDSNAYIDTGIAGNSNNLRITGEFMYSNFIAYGAIYGNYVADSSNRTRIILNSRDDSLVVDLNTGGSTVVSCSRNARHQFESTYSTITIDGVATTTIKTARTANAGNIALFNRSTTNLTSRDIGCKIYWLKIYDNDVLLRDFIPVRKNGVGYMYDRVSGQLFSNVGTGNFTYGNDIE